MKKLEPSYIAGGIIKWLAICQFYKMLDDSAIPILAIYTKKSKALIWKDTGTLMFIAVLLNNWQNTEATWVSTNRWMDEEDVVYMYNGIPLSHKK